MKKAVSKTPEQILELDHPIISKKIKKTLNSSITEGSLASIMNGSGVSYFSPFLLALNATSSQVGFLNSLTSLLPSIAQLKTSRLVEKFSRKKVLFYSTLLQSLVFIPLIILGLFFSKIHYSVWIAISLICLVYIFGSIAHPSWFSWMGSLVPENKRGAYFSKRNRIAGFFGLVSMLAGALILDKFSKLGFVLIGFGILFFIAFLARFTTSFLFLKHYEPRLKIKKRDYFSLWQFLKNGRKTPFGRFTIFTSLIRIATNIAAPFFAVYMLRDLGFSYSLFMAITVSATIFNLISLPLFGKFSDRFGNILLLKVSSFCFALVPILWIFSQNPYYLIFVPQLINGLAWAGFGLATNNYIYDSIKQGKRSFGIAYFNFLVGIGLFVGAGIGSLIALLEINFMNKFLFIFLISGTLIIIALISMRKYLREVRSVKEFSKQFIIKELNPAVGITKEFHRLNQFREKIIHYD